MGECDGGGGVEVEAGTREREERSGMGTNVGVVVVEFMLGGWVGCDRWGGVGWGFRFFL